MAHWCGVKAPRTCAIASQSVSRGSGGGLAQQSLEFGECHLDRIEIRRIGRQVEKDRAPGLDRGADALDLVGGQVVDHDDVALRQARSQHFLNIDQEGFAVHRSIQHPRRDQAVAAQSGRKGGGLPMPEGRLADQPLATTAAPVGADHLGRGSGLVDEHQACRIKQRLGGLPALTRFGYVGPILLGGVQSFFEGHPVPPEKAVNRAVRRCAPRSRISRCTISAKVRSCSLATSSNNHNACVSSGERLLPLRCRGLTLPVSSCNPTHRTADAALTAYRIAAARREHPSDTAATTRVRRSSEYGSSSHGSPPNQKSHRFTIEIG